MNRNQRRRRMKAKRRARRRIASWRWYVDTNVSDSKFTEATIDSFLKSIPLWKRA